MTRVPSSLNVRLPKELAVTVALPSSLKTILPFSILCPLSSPFETVSAPSSMVTVPSFVPETTILGEEPFPGFTTIAFLPTTFISIPAAPLCVSLPMSMTFPSPSVSFLSEYLPISPKKEVMGTPVVAEKYFWNVSLFALMLAGSLKNLLASFTSSLFEKTAFVSRYSRMSAGSLFIVAALCTSAALSKQLW